MPTTKISAEDQPEQEGSQAASAPAAGDLDSWLEATLRHYPGAKDLVMAKLKDDWCLDYPSLVECWDDLKDNIPGVLRSTMSKQLDKDRFNKVSATPQLLASNWMTAWGVALVAMVAPSVLAAFKDRSRQVEEVVRENVHEVWVPLGLLCVLQYLFCAAISPKIGWNMIEQRSNGISLREAMRNNMTNQAVIGALFLTVVWTMAVDQTMAGDDRFSFICQWYEGFTTLAIGQLLVAVMTCCFNTLYVEPLDDMASLKFVKDNFVYFGEPMALMLAALYNAICATILWVFTVYGIGLGVCFSISAGCAILRMSVVYGYLCRWKNPYLTLEDQEARVADAANMARAGEVMT
ncbi:unnamed protein product [Durusdinium trenchii]|uniref:Phthiocerol synthesis polyketide synthase type I PpsA n=2 Tax=Durusdinium trenchii TaxID=1381693 RepID=A0ABP0SKJ5_9DINO